MIGRGKVGGGGGEQRKEEEVGLNYGCTNLTLVPNIKAFGISKDILKL